MTKFWIMKSEPSEASVDGVLFTLQLCRARHHGHRVGACAS